MERTPPTCLTTTAVALTGAIPPDRSRARHWAACSEVVGYVLLAVAFIGGVCAPSRLANAAARNQHGFGALLTSGATVLSTSLLALLAVLVAGALRNRVEAPEDGGGRLE